MEPTRRYAIPRWYYVMTPVFIVLDYVLGLNIRTAALDAVPGHKSLYYSFCVLCGVVVLVRPRVSMVVATVESTIILYLTLVSLLMPYLVVTRSADLGGDWSLVGAFDLSTAINLVIVGIIAILAFRANVKALTGRDVLHNP